VRAKIYQTVYWKEQCFGLSAEMIVDKAVELRSVGGTFGGVRRPTEFLCLVLKMLQIQPDKDIIIEFIKNEEFKYVRLLGGWRARAAAPGAAAASAAAGGGAGGAAEDEAAAAAAHRARQRRPKGGAAGLLRPAAAACVQPAAGSLQPAAHIPPLTVTRRRYRRLLPAAGWQGGGRVHVP
jgi:hypothetical protein